jgi:hypothetical protein
MTRNAGKAAIDARSAVRSRGRALRSDAAQDALDVADGAQWFAQALEAAGIDEQADRLVPPAQFLRVRERPVDPAAQAP